jgi:hypothetical protein
MRPRSAPWLAVLVLAAGPALRAAPVPANESATLFKPTAVWRIKPADDLLADVRYVTGLIARLAPSDQEAKQLIEGADKGLDTAFGGADWRQAWDTSKPVFGYLNLEANLAASTGVLLVPVREEKLFLTVLKRLVGNVAEEPNGVRRFDLPGARPPSGMPVNGYLRFHQGYAYLTIHDPGVLNPSRLPAPAQIYRGDDKAVASVHVFLDRVPQSLKDAALTGVQQFKALLRGEAMPGGGMGTFGIGFAETFFVTPLLQVYPYLEPAIRDGQELTLDLRFNRPRLDLSYDLTLTPKPGSELARLAAAVPKPTSLFNALLGDAAARWQMRFTIPEDLRKGWVPKLETGLKELPQGVPVWGALAAQAGNALLPTLREGNIDFAAGLRGPGNGERYAIVAGLRLKDGTAVGASFRAAVQGLPKDIQDNIILDVMTVDGIKVHQIRLPKLPEPVGAIFGNDVEANAVYIAFRPDAVVAAYGTGVGAALAEGLTGKAGPVQALVVEASAKRLVPLVTKIDAEAGKKFRTFMGKEIDQFRLFDLTIEGGPALRVRYGGNGMLTAGMAGWLMYRTAEIRPAPAALPVAPVAPPPPRPPVR